MTETMSQHWSALTEGQLDFWEEYLAHPNVAVSTVAHVTRLEGDLCAQSLARAIEMVAAETDVLSLRFRAEDPPSQRVDPDCRPRLRSLDLRAEPDPEAEARRLMQQDIDTPLDLCAGAVGALWLMRIGADQWLWYLRGHHIFLDGYAMAMIERRVAQLYAHFAHQADAGRPFARFAAYLQEETDYHASPRHAAARDFWRDYLSAGAPPTVLRKGSEDYPAHPRSAEMSLAHLSDDLRAAAARHGLGWPDLLIMLVGLWLWAVPDHEDGRPETDRLVWLPWMGRLGSVSAQVPAMVLNIVPFRVAPAPDAPLSQTLAGLAQGLRVIRKHGRYRIEEMARDAGLAEDQRYHFSPLINVMPFDPAVFSGLRSEREVLAAGPGDGFNVTISAGTRAQDLRMFLDADPQATSSRRFDLHCEGLPQFLARCLSAPGDPSLRVLLG